ARAVPERRDEAERVARAVGGGLPVRRRVEVRAPARRRVRPRPVDVGQRLHACRQAPQLPRGGRFHRAHRPGDPRRARENCRWHTARGPEVAEGADRELTAGRSTAVEYKVISTDNHINEPPGTYVDRLPKALKDRAPRIMRGDDGGDGWSVDGKPPKNTFGL